MSIVTHTSPPYYAVIFTSIRTDAESYSAIAEHVLEEAKKQKGFLGFESARNEIGISVSYWSDLESIHTWKEQTLHKKAQAMVKHPIGFLQYHTIDFLHNLKSGSEIALEWYGKIRE
ncbi:antibiotic biosynthesis monooxygenase family protein, partial [Sulfuricurvum sp.]|uniref:antibiotic biosynthesis monooxygenase family protein n=1 Tax=Sulfuricurvum sp. TaxID=2025608 RepID=UPI003BB4D3D2